MKKLIALCLAGTLALSLAACGGTVSSESASATEGAESEAVSSEPESDPEPTPDASTSFADGVLITDGYTITITDYRVLQPGETGNEYGDVPVIAFWYDTTNTGSDSDINASSAWIMVFEAIQDNDPNVVNTLNMGLLPDSQYLDSQTQTIKVGGTVSNAIAYELDDTTTPVTLVASDIMEGEYGRQDFLIENAEQPKEAEEGFTTTPQEFAEIVEDFLNQGGAAGSTAVADGNTVTVNYLFTGENFDIDTVSENEWAEFKQLAMDYYQSLKDTADTLETEVAIILNYTLQDGNETTLLTIQDDSITYDVAA